MLEFFFELSFEVFAQFFFGGLFFFELAEEFFLFGFAFNLLEELVFLGFQVLFTELGSFLVTLEFSETCLLHLLLFKKSLILQTEDVVASRLILEFFLLFGHLSGNGAFVIF